MRKQKHNFNNIRIWIKSRMVYCENGSCMVYAFHLLHCVCNDALVYNRSKSMFKNRRDFFNGK